MRSGARRRVTGWWVAAALCAAAPAAALNVTAVTVETNPTTGAPGPGWTTVTPAVNAPVPVGTWIRLTLTLENTSGMLGHLCVDPTANPANFTFCTGPGPQYDCGYHNGPGEFSDQYWVWPIMSPACPDTLSAGNPGAPVSFVSASPGVAFDYNGQTYDPAAPHETETVTWVYKAERPAAGLDFRVLAGGAADASPAAVAAGCIPSFDLEGTGFDCGSSSLVGDGTLGTILGTVWGGASGNSLMITSPLDASGYVRVLTSSARPAGLAYVDDHLLVELSVTNTGASPVAVTACAAPNAPFGLCLLTANGNALCGGAQRDADTPPAMPLTLAAGASHVFTWTWSVGGWCTSVAGPVSWNLYANSVLAKTPVFSVQPAPLAVSVTVWVDPDSGGPAAFMPLGSDPVTGETGPVYYMGDEVLEERVTYTNVSGAYGVDLNPSMDVSLSPTYRLIASPALPVPLAPGAQVTLTWRFDRDPAGLFATCQAPTPFGVTLAALGSGFNAAAALRAQPTPFTPSDPCPGGCAVSRPALLLAPVSAPPATPYAVTLELTNQDHRPFRLPAPGAFSLLLDPGNTACTTITGTPGPGPYDWAADETKTFPFTVTSGCAGTQCFTGGIAWAPPPSLCALTCNDGVPFCGSLDACTAIRPTGNLQVTAFGVSPAATCDSPTECLPVTLDVRNLSGTDPVTVTRISDSTMPDASPAGTAFPCPAPPAPAVSPVPPLPFTIPPGQTQLVTWYMHGICGTTYLGAFQGVSLVGGYSKANADEQADWLGGPAPKVIVTTPAFLWCDVVAGAKAYSTGQVVPVQVTVENQGEDDLAGFALAIAANGTAAASLVSGPVPPLPAVLVGKKQCLPNPPYPSNATYTYNFAVTTPGTVSFTVTPTGTDPVCALPVTASASYGGITVAAAAQLACSAQAPAVVTMSATCPGCALHGACNPATGVGCINVTLQAANGGAVTIQGATPAHGTPESAYLGACPGPACTPATAVLRSYPPEADVPGSIGAGSTATYAWTYSPTGLGCVRVHTEFNGTDAGSKAPLYCDAYTGCVDVLARYPLELRLTSVPAMVAPGQEFRIGVRVCNPGQTPAGLQNGEPALSFANAATGAILSTEYAVYPPAATVLAPGACLDLSVPVIASPHATPARLQVRVSGGDLYIARDAATGLPFHAVDAGGPAGMTMTDGRNLLEVAGPNPFRPGSDAAVRFTYQVSAAGPASRTRLAVYTLTGEAVLTLLDKAAETERGEAAWDGKSPAGRRCASGIYLVRLTCGEFVAVRKLALVR